MSNAVKPPSVAKRARWEPDWHAALIVVLVFVAYIPAILGGYVWDDDSYVTANPLLTEPDGLKRIWFSAHTQSQYFPLVFTTLRLEYTLWGYDPIGYHMVNVGLHCINALLVWKLLRRLAAPGAWLAAAIFALHPVQVESVAWITELKNTESTMFYLLAVWAWLKFTGPPTSRAWLFYAAAILFHALALFSKTTACTLPAVLLLVLWVRDGSIGWRRFAQTLPFFAMGIVMGLVSIWWEKHLGNYGRELAVLFTPLERMLIAGRAIWFYVGKLIFPVNLTFSYPLWNINPHDASHFAGPLACVLLAGLLWWKRKQLGRGVIGSVLFFAVVLAPMLGFVSLYTFRFSFVADHYQYLACLGLIVLFAAAGTRLADRFLVGSRAWLSPVFVGVLLLALAGLTWQQSRIYRDMLTIWQDTREKNPRSWLAHLNIGYCLVNAGQYDEAMTEFEKSIAIKTNELALNNLGYELLRKGKPDEAIAQFNASLGVRSSYPTPHANLGIALAMKGRIAEALNHYRESLRLDPNDFRTQNGMAWLLATYPEAEFRNGTEAVRLAEAASLKNRHKLAAVEMTLAAAYAEAGRFDEAATAAENALMLAQASHDVPIATKAAQMRELFVARKPFREDPRLQLHNVTPDGATPQK